MFFFREEIFFCHMSLELQSIKICFFFEGKTYIFFLYLKFLRLILCLRRKKSIFASKMYVFLKEITVYKISSVRYEKKKVFFKNLRTFLCFYSEYFWKETSFFSYLNEVIFSKNNFFLKIQYFSTKNSFF